MVYIFALLTIVSALAFPIILIRVFLKKSRGRLLFIPPIAFLIFSVLGGYSLPDQSAVSAKQEGDVMQGTSLEVTDRADEEDATAAAGAKKAAEIEEEAKAIEETKAAEEAKAAALKEADLKAQQDEKIANALTPSTVEVACEQEAQRLLKLPNTANFPSVMETERASVLKNEGAWSSWIEGENSFGGTVRTYFDCYYDGDSGVATIMTPSD